MPDPTLAQHLKAANYRVPLRLHWAGTRYAAYVLPPEYHGLITEARAIRTTGPNRGRPFVHSPQCKGRTVRFAPDAETGAPLLWVTIHKGPDNMPPAEDTMILELEPTPEYTRYPYRVTQVTREDAAA